MKIVIGAHGELGRELICSAEMVFGTLEGVSAVPLLPGMSFEDYRREADSVLRKAGGEQVLVLADLFGGTPCNVFSALSKPYGCRVVTGVNLPVLIEAYAAASSHQCKITADELVEKVLSVLRESGVYVNGRLASR